jgi:hypothetical protein
MNSRTAYLRSNSKGKRIQQRIAAVALLALAAGMTLLLQAREPELKRREMATTPAASAPATAAVVEAAPGGPRRVYPYSIVPGGVLSRAELAQAILADKVVAAHYAGIQVDKVEPITVTKARAVHVSYRKGDKVFWTAKKVMLQPGEVLLSDGEHLIRGRCGNRISDVAMLPVEAGAPSEEELDSSVQVAQEGEGDDGMLEVAAAFDDGGGAHQSYALLSYPNGPGVSGGAWHAPTSPFGNVPGISRPITTYATPTVATTGGAAADTADMSGRTIETAAESTPPATVTGGRSTIETSHITETPATTPVTTPAALPTQLADTVLPLPQGEATAPALPGTLPWPGDLPALPAQPLPAPVLAEAPEPASLWLAGVGFAALLFGRGRRRRRRPA